jgi:L-amino acid N-acyltransferase YncA
MMSARTATIADVPAITAIYNEGIADRIATFETEPRTAGQVEAWLGRRYPVLVVEDGTGTVLAWASTSSYRERACYAGIAEFSVYVGRAHRGKGAGRVALIALKDAAVAAGFWKLLSRVFVENEASRALCRSLGFREVGTYEKHGKLDGVWRDVVVVECLIGEAAE